MQYVIMLVRGRALLEVHPRGQACIGLKEGEVATDPMPSCMYRVYDMREGASFRASQRACIFSATQRIFCPGGEQRKTSACAPQGAPS